MEAIEKYIKLGLLNAFCFLNAIDLAQTLYFLKIGVEGNPFVVFYPGFWFVLKVFVAFGVPVGLYRFDLYLEEKESEGFFSFMKLFVRISYIIVFLGDIFYLSLVLTNMRFLGRIIP